MYTSQDVAGSIGNRIALPLQGQALKNGNSAFADKDGNAYPEQWDVLLNHTAAETIVIVMSIAISYTKGRQINCQKRRKQPGFQRSNPEDSF